MILDNYFDKQKEEFAFKSQVFSWVNVATGVRFVQPLVRCSFSSALLKPTPPPPTCFMGE